MTAGVPFPIPPDRVLSSWRRALTAFQPRRLWLGQLLLHRVEALVRIARRHEVEPVRLALLRQLAEATPLDQLRVDRDMLARWLHELSADGLIEPDGEGRLTERGRQALDSGAYTASVEERRVFTFLDEGDPSRPLLFAPFHGRAVALAPPPGWRFDAATLEECARRSKEWKTRHGFPTDVEAVLGPAAPDTGAAPDWRRVILDRPEQLLMIFIRSDDAAQRRRLGFAVRADDWVLQTDAPALSLDEDDREALPALGAEPSPEAWREAWRVWCQRRGLSDADACRIEALADRVRVVAPRGLASTLGGDRNEAWLLAGAGRTRVAAPMEIVEG
ncbi:MAG TPA: hypothetical protein DDY78_21610 [Planctomycetales bacterium]|jgi:hypothetical protein|nr:hypothetical protein [Planctomycetales bacterium]